jgi:hypothetical protein
VFFNGPSQVKFYRRVIARPLAGELQPKSKSGGHHDPRPSRFSTKSSLLAHHA